MVFCGVLAYNTLQAPDSTGFHSYIYYKKNPASAGSGISLLLSHCFNHCLTYTYKFPLHFVAKVKVIKEEKVCIV